MPHTCERAPFIKRFNAVLAKTAAWMVADAPPVKRLLSSSSSPVS